MVVRPRLHPAAAARAAITTTEPEPMPTTSPRRHRPRSRKRLPAAAAFALFMVAGVIDGGTAWAHAFQVQNLPAHGARLREAPDEVALQFSEAVVAESVEMSARLADGRSVRLASPVLQADGKVAKAALAATGDGVYLVSWQVVAADDGHVTAGEFAFAVGTGADAVADRAQSDEPVPAAAVLGGWLLFVGLAVAVGALLAERRLPVGLDEATFLRLLTRGGLLLAIGGAGASGLPAVAATRAASASGIAVGATVAALTVTLLVAERPGVRTWALAPAVAAAAAWSARSHASAYGGLLVTTNNAVHLAAASAWVGLLAVVVAVLWRARQRRDLQLRLVRGYAAPALWLVIVVAGSGVASATTLLTDLTDLAATRYGWALTVKVALVAVAIAMALAARTWGLGAGHIPILRRLATSELTVLAAVLLATATLTSFSPPIAAAATELLLGPPPITGPTARAAGMAGNLNVAVLAGDDQLQVEVFGPSGPVPGTDAEVSATLPDGRLAELRPRPCGDGCSVLRYALPDGTTEVTVDAGAPDWTGGRFVGDLSWPPPATRPELLREVVTAMRDVPTLTLTEQVSSGPNAVGPRTTTELSGKRYLELSPYGSGEAVDIRPLAEISDAVVLALPGSRMLVTLWLDDQRRVIRERIVSPGHVISRTISYPP